MEISKILVTQEAFVLKKDPFYEVYQFCPSVFRKIIKMANYDYDAVARVFYHSSIPVVEREEGALSFECSDKQPPTDQTKQREFIEKYNFTHGDVLRFSDYRDSETYLLVRDEDGTFHFILNPDDQGAAYLTIPWRVTKHVKDCLTKFALAIKSSASTIIRMPPWDKTIKEKLQGDDKLPDEWRFEAIFSFGEFEELYLPPIEDISWLDNPKAPFTLENLTSHMALAKEELAKLFIDVKLEGDALKEYQQKYNTARTHAPHAKPRLPSLWQLNISQASYRYENTFVAISPQLHGIVESYRKVSAHSIY